MKGRWSLERILLAALVVMLAAAPILYVMAAMAPAPVIDRERIFDMKKHEWRETTEDNKIRLVCVTQHAGKWKLRHRLKSDEEWICEDKIDVDDLESLLGIIEGKYRRRRVPHAHVLEVEALLASAKSARK